MSTTEIFPISWGGGLDKGGDWTKGFTVNMRDSLTSKTKGILRVPLQDASDTLISFGVNLFDIKKYNHEDYD